MNDSEYEHSSKLRCKCGHEGAIEELDTTHIATPGVSLTRFKVINLNGESSTGYGAWTKMKITCPVCGAVMGLNNLVT
jgi:hypothetical protein